MSEQLYRIQKLEKELDDAKKLIKKLDEKVWNLEEQCAKANTDFEKRLRNLEISN